MRRIPLQFEDEEEACIKKMLVAGVIQESNSDWASSPVFIRKKDGTIRYAIDYRHLNACTVKSSFSLPGPQWQSGNTLASHLCGRGSIPVMAVSGKAGSCLPLVGSLQYRTLTNYMYWFPLPFQLPVVI